MPRATWKSIGGPLVLVLCWCLLMAVLYMRSSGEKEDYFRQLALAQTRTLYTQIVDARAWNAGHGGVYVRESAYGAPNPYIPEDRRVLELRDGSRLVLINPAYMSRQIAERSSMRGASFRITSNDPVRPANRADSWEDQALRRCEAGEKEVFSLEDGIYRYMAPLALQGSCLSCHVRKRPGELRGGISVNLNAYPFLHSAAEGVRDLGLFYGAAGLLGVLIIGGCACIRNRRRILAEEAERMKSTFLANMSHDMRTPLAGILGMNEVLAASDDPAARARASAYLRESAASLLEMVNDITDHAALAAGRLRLSAAPFLVRRALERCLHLHRPQCEAKGLTLTLEVDPGVPPCLLGDDFRLRQALGNLVGNAVRYTSQGGIRVGVDYDAAESILRCRVSDTGPGVAARERSAIFERFERGSAARQHSGAGLGLAIARDIARRMDGDVTLLENTDDPAAPHAPDGAQRGATFLLSVRLPAVAPQDAPAPPPPPSPRAARVLLAEDNAVSACFLRHVLAMAGHTAAVAADGVQALLQLERDPFDLLLLDLRLPLLDGLEVARRVRAQERFAALPVIIVTASLEATQNEELRQLGVSAILIKPADADAVLRAVAAALSDAPDPAPSSPAPSSPDAAAPSSPDDADIFDHAAALEAMNNEDALLRRLAALFLQDLPAQCDALERAVHDGDEPTARRLAHALKNSAATLHCRRLSRAAAALESATLSGGQIPDLLRTVLDAARLTRQRLESLS